MKRGFTLLDLLIVILILGVLAMLAGPELGSLSRTQQLNEAAAELTSALRYAGELAIRHQRAFGVRFEPAANAFWVFDARYRDDATPHHDQVPPTGAYGVVLNPADRNWYRVAYDDLGAYAGVKITSAPTGNEIRFYPAGHAGLSEQETLLDLGGEQRRVTVHGPTARISVR